MPPTRPLDVVLAIKREITEPPFTHDRLGRPLVGPCMVWSGKLPRDGYPRLTHKTWGQGKPQLVHRVAYALAHSHPLDRISEIPTLDHLCRRTACSAAAHLEPTTRPENLARGNPNQNERKEVCDNGHAFTYENTYVRTNGTRECRECKRKTARESWRRKHAPELVGREPIIKGRPKGAVVFRDAKPRRNWSDGT